MDLDPNGGDVNELDWTTIDWDLLSRYQGGLCGDDERQRVAAWLAESPARWGLLSALPMVADVGERGMSAERKADVVAKLRARRSVGAGTAPTIASTDAARAVRAPTFAVGTVSRGRWIARAAAVVALLGAGVLGGRAWLAPNPDAAPSGSRTRVFATARGERLSRNLPDGSEVMLAPASRLRIAENYGVGGRVVWLEGEAAFTVVHDSTRPFVVRTARGSARDLGTRFVVRAYRADSADEVIVAEGKVAVGRWTADRPPADADMPDIPTRDTVVMGRGERARITATQLVVAHDVGLDAYFDWTEGRLVFRRVPLREAVVRLSRWYDIDIALASPALGDELLTATLEGEPAPQAMSLIATTFHLRLDRDGRRYTFHPQ